MPQSTRRTFVQLAAALAVTKPVSNRAGEADLDVVRTSHGQLRGRIVESVATFLGIPYAAPTNGSNRFLAPKPAAKWQGVRDATRHGHHCPQVLRVKGVYPYPEWIDPETASEDCLNLNVWAPTINRSTPRAVMVWFHGGGYSRGSGNIPMYDGRNLAQQGDVVVVTVNHRLNIFGFLHVAKMADARFANSGNAGLLDLVAALRWVRTNIAAFGGDPANVTIFGESGGGGKVSALLAMPSAKGLFHKAIVMSGSSLEVLPPALAENTADQVFAYFKARPGDVRALQAIPANELYDCFEKLTAGAVPGVAANLPFGPVLDGIAIPQQTWTPNAPEISRDIPMLIGCSTDETAAFIAEAVEELIPDDAALIAKIRRYGGPRLADTGRVTQLLASYRAAMPELTRNQLLVRITTDAGMWRNAITQAARKNAAGAAPAYLYEFGWQTPSYGSAWALHSLILPFVFGNHDYEKSWDLRDTRRVREAIDPNHDYKRLGAEIIAIWSTFARSGNPAIASLGDWPPYSADARHTMLLARQSHLTGGLRESVRGPILAL